MIEKWAENLDEATVSRWVVAAGEEVEAGDVLCEIITDKATFEYEAERDGVVKALYCPARSTVPVGYVIAFIGDADEEPPEDIERMNQQVMDEHRAAAEEELELDLEIDRPRERRRRGKSGDQRRVRGTPAARRLARDRDLSLQDVAEALDVRGVVNEEHVRTYLDEE